MKYYCIIVVSDIDLCNILKCINKYYYGHN